MGSACCVAARDTTPPNGESQRNTICSSSGRFRWDNHQRVLAATDNHSCQSCEGISTDARIEMKDGIGSERGNTSDLSSALENLGTPVSQKSPPYEGINTNYLSPSDTSMMSNYFSKMNPTEPPETASLPVHLPFSAPSSSSVSTPLHLLPPTSTPSRRARHSPGHQLFRQISDSRILGLKSPSSHSLSEGRPSFVLSTFSNDLAGGSSDGWSLRTFSELVASSQRERWSFDSEHFASGRHKINGSSSRYSSYSPSVDLQTCGVCLKVLAEFSVAAVLACGHVYHDDCLENMSTEADKYDPLCPICTLGQKQASKTFSKVSKADGDLKMKFQRISRSRVMDSFLDVEGEGLHNQKLSRKGKLLEIGSSSASKMSFAKPFFKRQFFLGSKRSKPSLESEFGKKKGFWARYRKD